MYLCLSQERIIQFQVCIQLTGSPTVHTMKEMDNKQLKLFFLHKRMCIHNVNLVPLPYSIYLI